jgi:hypothetical protein
MKTFTEIAQSLTPSAVTDILLIAHNIAYKRILLCNPQIYLPLSAM